ncbi:hypothetical protein [Streptomyces sp. NPDC049555]|uniref:hypothetical protein n=1 Tax=Streptomyces sp. NPDC049555 TaxID=3154930 RepID=UPI00343EA0B6
MSECEDLPEEESEGRTCQWCHGSGYVSRALARTAGPDPFAGPAETVHRAGQCRRCRGTGAYDSALDPTLDRESGRDDSA